MEGRFQAMPWEDVEDITRIANEKFMVEERFFYSGLLSFTVSLDSPDIKGSFEKFVASIKGKGYIPFLRMENGHLTLRIATKPPMKKSRKTISISY